MTDLHALDLTALSGLLHSGEISANDLLSSCLTQARARDGEVRALVDLLAASARAEAHAADRRLRRGDRGPLLGIPVLVKNLIDVRGVVTRAGTVCPAHRPAGTDALAVRRLRAAGAVVLGTTHTHQFAYGGLTPPTRNPWNTRHAPGGSSGGSAAALATGMAPAALGTDTLGSVRAPAAFCGVVGLKPTTGLVPTQGVLPLAPGLDTVGPMARSARDCALLLRAMLGDGPPVRPSPGATAAAPRVGVLEEFGSVLSPAVRAACTNALETLSGTLTLDGVRGGDPLPAHEAAGTVLAAEAAGVHGSHLAEHPACYTPVISARLAAGALVTAREVAAAREAGRALRARLDALLVDREALITPALIDTAPELSPGERRSVDGVTLPLGTSLTLTLAPFSLSGHPALVLPAGRSPQGLPVGIQLVGRRGGDLELLELAGRVERALGGAVLAPPAHGAGSVGLGLHAGGQ